MLNIKKLFCSINKTLIIKGLDLKIKEGSIHLLMGPNGTGKSTLFFTITGKPNYKINKGNIFFKKKKINGLSPYEISKLGIYLTFQNPIEIDGIKIIKYLKYLRNIKYKKIYKFCKVLRIKKEYLNRYFNLGFSGGEKKKNEILQLLILKPKLILLDEIDSGLDIDTIKIIFKIINNYLKINKKSSLLIISHNTNIINYIKPNKIHIMHNGSIISSNGVQIIKKLEKFGYNYFLKKNN
ncbi:MAG: Fe-S cluster assembly ATPase SufC [Candidatus Shikimatogenerans bostrichidophilus]|nr:MAG: Fe-S cluster assembly ATPase SufC [Candidatus Shikimatogenerans bostrichidophilus]